jgi:hypothetical protein
MDISTGNIKLSNVIGAPFRDYVLLQLYMRAAQGGTKNRSHEQVMYLANKTAWVRLTSSVNVILPAEEIQTYYKSLGVTVTDTTEDALARNWVLQAGTSTQGQTGNGVNLRYGIGSDGAYGLGGTEELGYRPMPGLTAVNIETTGRLGSLRLATINFKVWNMHQLNVIEALYFRLGYSMILEWGHTQYYNNDGTFKRNEIFGIPNPFSIADVEGGKRKEYIQQQIAKKAHDSSGNYDGMMGVVSHFNWSMNQEGGYDCSVKLVGLGSIIDSVRINQAYKIPGKLIKAFKSDQALLEQAIKNFREEARRDAARIAKLEAEKKAQEAFDKANKVGASPRDPVELGDKWRAFGNGSGNIDQTQIPIWDSVQLFQSSQNGAKAYNVGYWTPFGGYASNAETNKQAIERFGGMWWGVGSHLGFVRQPVSGVSAVMNTNLMDYLFAISSVGTPSGNGTSRLGKAFDSVTRLFQSPDGTSKLDVGLDEQLTQVKFSQEVQYNTWYIDGSTFGGPVTLEVKSNIPFPVGSKIVYPTITYTVEPDKSDTNYNKYYQPTRRQIIAALDNWFLNGRTLSNVKLTYNAFRDPIFQTVQVTGETLLEAQAGFLSNQPDAERNKATITAARTGTWTPVKLTVSTNNPGYISTFTIDGQNPAQTGNTANEGSKGDQGGTFNKSDQKQYDSSLGYASALHAMLIVVESRAQVQALKQRGVIEVDITPETIEFYNDGVLKGLLTDTNKIPNKAEPFNLLTYAKKGFNSDLMVDPLNYSITPDVDFKQLCKAYVVKYPTGVEFSPRSPVYIPLGYLLAFLNNMCLVYDSVDATLTTSANANSSSDALKDNSSHPYFYVDFNPETNFCLTTPQQLSVDPYVCLIPFNADDPQYMSIFPKDAQLKPKFNPSVDTKNGGDNVLTAALQNMGVEFKPKQTSTQANRDYQGKIMNILINVEYLIDLVREYQGSDKEHAVRFQPFLERILIDVNKSMGNINSFRIAYRDDSNVVQIQDDQWVPSLVAKNGGTEISMLQSTSYNSKLKAEGTRKLAGLLPLFSPEQPGQLEVGGSLGIAREFKISTIFSTRLASTIAISAQAETGSVNATDHSSLSWMNINKQDRYKKYIKDASSDLTAAQNQSKNNKVDQNSANLKAAQMFNDHISSVYSTFTDLNKERVESAKNYYIERMSKVKSGDILTTSAPFIPVELNLTLDGVSGIIMGNAFTVPEERLPLSLRGENGLSKIAFIVSGLHHTIENNEWITRIKGQVIKLRQQTVIPKASTTTATIQYKVAANSGGGSSGGGTVNDGTSDYQLSTYAGKVDRVRADGSIYKVCPYQYPGAGSEYSCARQVKTVMTQAVFDKQYGYVFKKNISDIKLPSGVSPLTFNEIVNKTNENHFDQGTIPSPVANFVIHHTGGGSIESNIGTFKERGFPAQYLIDKAGKIYQFMPNGALAWHAGNFNSHSIGVEVIGSSDADIAKRSKENNNVQLIAAARLAQYLGFSRSQIIGHGKVPGADKNANEGKTIVDYINTLV